MSNAQAPPCFGRGAILAARSLTLREANHTLENGYIHFVNDCDLDRYLDVSVCVVPAASSVSRRHAHSTGPWRK
ncbi:hypothetical protein C7G83_11335 [Siccibacter turicensis]|uniref:Uncharacterized protein n=1 Tax=Siccibacter turicensis TaxID=357233 RepID=A0A2P8VJH4_9ENTR|nr:hypothetical protein C7G83_11335 [Siccibacter turicensis]